MSKRAKGVLGSGGILGGFSKNQSRKFDKAKSFARIDPLIAVTMAIGIAGKATIVDIDAFINSPIIIG